MHKECIKDGSVDVQSGIETGSALNLTISLLGLIYISGPVSGFASNYLILRKRLWI
jgi:hypothetical protein